MTSTHTDVLAMVSTLAKLRLNVMFSSYIISIGPLYFQTTSTMSN